MGALDMPLGAITLGWSRHISYNAPRKQLKTCMYCGKGGFTWTQHEGRWRLQKSGEIHYCQDAINHYRARFAGSASSAKQQRAVETFIASLPLRDQRKLGVDVDREDFAPLDTSGPEFEFDS